MFYCCIWRKKWVQIDSGCFLCKILYCSQSMSLKASLLSQLIYTWSSFGLIKVRVGKRTGDLAHALFLAFPFKEAITSGIKSFMDYSLFASCAFIANAFSQPRCLWYTLEKKCSTLHRENCLRWLTATRKPSDWHPGRPKPKFCMQIILVEFFRDSKCCVKKSIIVCFCIVCMSTIVFSVIGGHRKWNTGYWHTRVPL